MLKGASAELHKPLQRGVGKGFRHQQHGGLISFSKLFARHILSSLN